MDEEDGRIGALASKQGQSDARTDALPPSLCLAELPSVERIRTRWGSCSGGTLPHFDWAPLSEGSHLSLYPHSTSPLSGTESRSYSDCQLQRALSRAAAQSRVKSAAKKEMSYENVSGK